MIIMDTDKALEAPVDAIFKCIGDFFGVIFDFFRHYGFYFLEIARRVHYSFVFLYSKNIIWKKES